MTVQPVTTTQNLTADRSWLASLHVTRNVDSITLDLSTFVSGTPYMPPVDTNVPYSRLLSGLPVGKITASGLHGLYAPGAADGRRNLAGRLHPGPSRVSGRAGPCHPGGPPRGQGPGGGGSVVALEPGLSRTARILECRAVVYPPSDTGAVASASTASSSASRTAPST